ncbi:hypothetical protein AAMO2058_001462500 [Amorphochlora amoebiformis]
MGIEPLFGREGEEKFRGVFDSEVLGRLREKRFNPTEMVMLIWAYAQREESKAVIRDLFSVFMSEIQSFSPPELAMVANGIAKSNPINSETFLQKIAQALSCNARALTTLSPLDVSNLLWAFARVDVVHKKFFSQVAEHAATLLQNGSSSTNEENSNSRVGYEQKNNQFQPKHISNLIWALARTATRHPKIEAAAEKFAMERAMELNPRDLANLGWGLAVLGGKKRKKALSSLGLSARSKVREFNAQESSKFLWAITKAEVNDPKLQNAFMSKLDLTFNFPALNPNPNITLSSIPGGGRNLKNTGTAVWDASYAFSEWLSRQNSPNSSKFLHDFLPPPRRESGWDTWKGKRGVELGSGIGLVSIVSARLGVKIWATDGDPEVIKLLKGNAKRNVQIKDTSAEKKKEKKKKKKKKLMRVRLLKWKEFPDEAAWRCLGLKTPPDVVMATGVVYGSDPSVFHLLVETIASLCDMHTIVLLAHGQGAAPGLHHSVGDFFDMAEKKGFEHKKLPNTIFHPEYQRRGCVMHALRLRSLPKKSTENPSKAKKLSEDYVKKKRKRVKSQHSSAKKPVRKKSKKAKVKPHKREKPIV